MAGETISRSGLNDNIAPHARGPVVNGVVWSVELASTEMEANDVVRMGYLPEGATLIGFHYYVDDIDSGTTVAWKITVGASDVITGQTAGRTAGGGFLGVEPVVMTAQTLVSVTFTAAGTTGGTFYLVPLYIGQ